MNQPNLPTYLFIYLPTKQMSRSRSLTYYFWYHRGRKEDSGIHLTIAKCNPKNRMR